jgi:hypothetical protein
VGTIKDNATENTYKFTLHFLRKSPMIVRFRVYEEDEFHRRRYTPIPALDKELPLTM